MATGSAALILIGMLVSIETRATGVEELEDRVAALERELAEARIALASAREAETIADGSTQHVTEEDAETTASDSIRIGDFSIGGAIRANWTLGDYPSGSGPSRGGHGGDFTLDTFRVNVDYANDRGITGKLEYRWYSGYNMLHTGWIGRRLDDGSTFQAGVNRVPFGPGPYGVSNSWFFDQHYYVGLSDDMDLGIKYSNSAGDWTIDLAYYYSDEGNWRGSSRYSARYSYDVVPNESGDGYKERHQFNMRAIRSFANAGPLRDAGVSLQLGQLEANGSSDSDGDSIAVSAHGNAAVGGFDIAAQVTWYHHDIGADNAWGSGDLVFMGAYDFAWPVATKAWIPAISIRRKIALGSIAWIDSVTPYVEYSAIIKDADAFNDSELFVIGAAWASGRWYIYTDLAYSNGNYFVGSDGDDYSGFSGVGDFGINGNNTWNARFNINFGYYF